ncbi:hypothetical protein F4780DRAFT_180471 [Xylariomycetidae sp. FL0641]|nr:hypothetical protein F4780DRAFT_180471 [Xylariomycetidae sp. FL0641]
MKFAALPLIATLALGVLGQERAAGTQKQRQLAQGGNGTALAGNGTNPNGNLEDNLDDDNLEDIFDNLDNFDEGLDGEFGIDPNDVQGSIDQGIEDLMLSMGICDFDLGGIAGLGLGDELQLLLQLQQLAQLQQLGIVNSFAVDQLIQQELLLNNFSLNILKRSVGSAVAQAARGRKRTVIGKRQCGQ